MKDELFPEAQQILDFFHLCENLYSFTKIYFNHDESKYIPWVEKYKAMFKNGNHIPAINEIQQISKNKNIQ
ncbi:MAG: hypothetical protein LBP22_15995 [Deltaproteobacteria bacterium]|nr:hypothetical protein [Deltaproteobacteria bacterium]